jgi:hypothetical protein
MGRPVHCHLPYQRCSLSNLEASQGEMMVVHLDTLASYLGATRDDYPCGGSNVTCAQLCKLTVSVSLVTRALGILE